MKSPRVVTIALAAIFSCLGTGCRTAGLSDLTRRDVPRPAGRLTATELLVEHNANARKVQRLEARPSISVKGTMGVGLSGMLALERPRNFNLALASTMAGEVANIGSNDEEFWFWMKDSDPKAVFYCAHGETASSPLASTLQPDWIVESLGLQEFSREDLARARVEPGNDPDTVVLTQSPEAGSNQGFLKETVVRESTRRIVEQRIFSPDKKTLLARATVYDHQNVDLPAPEGTVPTSVYLPKRLRLEWTQEKLVLDVLLNKVKLNPVFEESQRTARFTKPIHEGYAQLNLAESANLASFDNQPEGPRTSTRRSLPAPPPRAKLLEPTPLGSLDSNPPPRPELASTKPILAMEPIDTVIGPMVPTVSEPSNSYVRERSGWKRRTSPYLER